MNFAKNLLGKYGWKEGDGLGRDKHGITKPLKANFKFDNSGLGHNPADDMNNHWWENVYNKAATNLNVETNQSNEVKMKLNAGESVEITTKNYSVKRNQLNDYGGSFLKSATLTNDGQEVDVAAKETISPVIFKIVSDADLFKACGGRTAHKGARHGLKLSGKLSRIEQQEQELIDKIRSVKVDPSQVFKEYADCKSRYNKKKLKRLNKREMRKKSSSKLEAVPSVNPIPIIPFTNVTEDEVMDEKNEERESSEEEQPTRSKKNKSRSSKLSTGRIDKQHKRKHKKKLKKLAKEMRVADSKDRFMKKLTINELPITFESVEKLKNRHQSTSDIDDISLHSYRHKDEQSHSDDGSDVQEKVTNQLAEKLQKVKKRKQKVLIENLTEFQIEHLRNAHIPFVEIKKSKNRMSRKTKAEFNGLANKMSSL